MTFGATFGRVFSPTFQPSSQAAAVAGGWWLAGGIAPANCVVAYQPKGAASYSASKVNLANPGTYDANDEGAHAPSWAESTGWYCDSSRYLLSGIVPGSGWTMIARINNQSNSDPHANICGCDNYTNGERFYLRCKHNTTARVYGYGDAAKVIANGAFTSGVMAIAGANCYLNGVSDGIAGTWKTTALPITIGALNSAVFNSVASHALYGYILALAIYNATLTAQNISDLTTAMNAL